MWPLTSFFFLSFIVLQVSSHDSGFTEYVHHDDDIEHQLQFHDIKEDFSSLSEKRMLFSHPQLRIKASYDALDTAPLSYKLYIQNQLAPAVIDYFQAALKVKYPSIENITLKKDVEIVCGIKTPSILHNEGVNADFFILFDSKIDVGNWVASSSACYVAGGSKRPIIARSLFNRNLLREAHDDPLIHEKNIYLLLHEMMHTLGFSKKLYSYFIDEYGDRMTDHIKTVSNRLVINVPFLTKRLQEYFGCETLEGIYLENDGGSGSEGSHLEKKHFLYEVMASGIMYGQRISEFSLGMLEATGWYKPDYNYAEPYFFGKGQGCNFIKGSCHSNNFEFGEYCSENSKGCTAHGRGGGSCTADSRSEECKYIAPEINFDCENQEGIKYSRLPNIEAYGRDTGSKCFSGNLTTLETSEQNSFCFKYHCQGSGSRIRLEVYMGKQKVICTKKGFKKIAGYNGGLNCPDPLEFCNTVGEKYCPRNCMGRGTCVNSKCLCKNGFSGIDCSISY